MSGKVVFSNHGITIVHQTPHDAAEMIRDALMHQYNVTLICCAGAQYVSIKCSDGLEGVLSFTITTSSSDGNHGRERTVFFEDQLSIPSQSQIFSTIRECLGF